MLASTLVGVPVRPILWKHALHIFSALAPLEPEAFFFVLVLFSPSRR